ncbi:MAG: phosphoribosylanthranilate isomerase [Steroidobacteraceae bacterium]
MTFQRPAFIAFTGVDRVEIVAALLDLSSRYPVEWGILVADDQPGNALFPDAALRTRLLASANLRWAAHICGARARSIANDPETPRMDLAGFQRAQINHSFAGSSETQTANSVAFGRRHGVRTMLQCLSDFPADLTVDWLFDTSFGKGAAPTAWPALPAHGPFCGFSGGLNPDNVRGVLETIAAPAGALYWIDMESGVRSDGWLDVAKCAAVCQAVYG